MSTFGPLQKLRRTLVASGALSRICTFPAPSTRGYSAPQTLVVAGLKSPDSWAVHTLAVAQALAASRTASPICLITVSFDDVRMIPMRPGSCATRGLLHREL